MFVLSERIRDFSDSTGGYLENHAGIFSEVEPRVKRAMFVRPTSEVSRCLTVLPGPASRYGQDPVLPLHPTLGHLRGLLVGIARKGWLEAKDVLNTNSTEAVDKYFKEV